MDTSNANQQYMTPQKGTNSSKTRRSRRRTALELCFGEEPVFSDSEDEAQYSHQASIHIAETLLLNGSIYNTPMLNINESNKLSSSVKDQILKICCDHCKCCKNIKGILNTSPEVDSFTLTSSSSSYNNDLRSFRDQNSTQKPEILNKMVRSSDTINLISCKIIQPPMPLMEVDFNQNADLSNGFPNGVGDELSIKYKGSEKMKMTTKPITILEEKKSSPNFTEEISENRLKNISSQLGSSENAKKTVKKKKSNISRANNENINSSSHCVTNISTWTLRNKKKSSNINIVRKIEATETEKVKKRKLHQNGNITNGVKNIKVTKGTETLSVGLNPKDSLKATECNLSSVIQADDTMIAHQSKRPSRERRVPKKHLSETDFFYLKGKQTSKTNYLKQNYIQSIDKPLFKIPIDTTNDRSYTKAVARKLARTGGLGFRVDSLNMTIDDSRTCQIPKLRNLYSSDEWLNSDEFLTLTFKNVRKTL